MKIDITKIPGYAAEMSAEDKLKLIEGYDIDMSGYVSKATADKYTSELAEYKRKYNATLSEQERKEAELAEQNKQRDKELEELKRERAIDKQTAKYLSLGFEPELASATAIASVDGNTDVVFTNMAKHQQDRDAKLKAEILKNTPTPPSGDAPNVTAQYEKMAAEAYASGDYSTGAYYTRLSQQNT